VITITQINEGNAKPAIILDGTESKDKYVHLVDDKLQHQAEVTLLTIKGQLLQVHDSTQL
jgi:hypothetical protein